MIPHLNRPLTSLDTPVILGLGRRRIARGIFRRGLRRGEAGSAQGPARDIADALGAQQLAQGVVLEMRMPMHSRLNSTPRARTLRSVRFRIERRARHALGKSG